MKLEIKYLREKTGDSYKNCSEALKICEDVDLAAWFIFYKNAVQSSNSEMSHDEWALMRANQAIEQNRRWFKLDDLS